MLSFFLSIDTWMTVIQLNMAKIIFISIASPPLSHPPLLIGMYFRIELILYCLICSVCFDAHLMYTTTTTLLLLLLQNLMRDFLTPTVSHTHTHTTALDHTRILGSTVEEIATKKAGIFKRGVPALVGPGCPMFILKVHIRTCMLYVHVYVYIQT